MLPPLIVLHVLNLQVPHIFEGLRAIIAPMKILLTRWSKKDFKPPKSFMQGIHFSRKGFSKSGGVSLTLTHTHSLYLSLSHIPVVSNDFAFFDSLILEGDDCMIGDFHGDSIFDAPCVKSDVEKVFVEACKRGS